jgi:hypothetical protein
MTTESTETPTSKTINDPVDPQVLQILDALSNTKQELAVRLAEMEMEKLDLLGALRKVQREFEAQIQRILSERGLDPQEPIQINPKDGTITRQE